MKFRNSKKLMWPHGRSSEMKKIKSETDKIPERLRRSVINKDIAVLTNENS